MQSLVFAAVLFASACHAGWNALIKVGLDPLSGSWGEEFCRGVFRAEFGQGRQIDDLTIISDILSQLHIDSASVLEAARAEMNKAALRARKPKKRSSSAFLARRLLRRRMVNRSGATIVLNARSLGQERELI